MKSRGRKPESPQGGHRLHLAHGADALHHHGTKNRLPLIIAAGEHCLPDYPANPPARTTAAGCLPPRWNKVIKLDLAYGRPERKRPHHRRAGHHVGGTTPHAEPPPLPHLSAAMAIAEAGWTPMNVRSWDNFRRKVAITAPSSSNASTTIWNERRKTSLFQINTPYPFLMSSIKIIRP